VSIGRWRSAWFLLGIAVFLLSFVCVIFIRNAPGDKGFSIYGGGEEPRPSARVTLFSTWRDVLREREIWKLGSVYFYVRLLLGHLPHPLHRPSPVCVRFSRQRVWVAHAQETPQCFGGFFFGVGRGETGILIPCPDYATVPS